MAAQILGGAATVLDMNIALLGLVPSNAIFNNQLGVVGANNANAAAYANQITNANFASTSSADLATIVLKNLLGTDPSNSPELNAALTSLLAANPLNRGVVINQLATILSGLENDAKFGAAAKTFNIEVTNGFTYSNDPINTTSVPPNPAPPVVTGRQIQLTTGIDPLLGTLGDDVFFASEATLTSGDFLSGNGGNDTLRFSSSGPTAVAKSGFSTTGIQNILVNSDAIGGTSFDVTDVTGATTLINNNSSTDVSFIGATSLLGASLVNVSGGNTSFNFQSSVVGGANDTMNVALSNNKTIAGGAIGTVSANGIESFNVVTSKGSSNIAELASVGSLKSITISGDQNLTLGAANFSGTTAANTVDASKLTGSLNLTLNNDGATGIAVAVTGGAGNDRVSFTTFDKGDSFTGGAGVNTIALTNAVATGTPGGTLSAVQTLEDTTASTGTINMNNFAGVTNVFLSAGLGGATIVSNATSGLQETVWVFNNAAADLSTSLKTDGTADAITLQLNKVGTASTVGNLNVAGFETVSLNAVQDGAVNGAGALTIASLNDSAATTLNINSAVSMTLTGSSTGALKVVDASASTGNLNLNSLTYATTGATIKGGAGKDSFAPGTGADTITLGAGADTLTYTSATGSNDKMDIVTDFTSGTDVLNLAGLGLIGSAQFLGSRNSFGLAQGALTASGNVSAVLDSSTNILWVDNNGDGNLDNRDFRIQLNGVTTLTAADLNLSAAGSGISVTGTNASISKTLSTAATGTTTDLGDTISTKIAFLATATIDGAAGTDTLVITDAGAVTVPGTVTNVEAIALATVGTTANTLAALPAGFKSVTGSANADTYASTASLGAGYTVSLGDGTDVVTALAAGNLSQSSLDLGAGDDKVTSTVGGSFGTAYTLSGGAGTDTLVLAAGDDISGATVSGFETINLAGNATMTVAQYNAATTVAGDAVAANTITFTTAGSFTTTAIAANVGVESYTLAAGTNTITTGGTADATRTITGTTGAETLNTTVANGFFTNFVAAGGTDSLVVTGGLTAAVTIGTAAASGTKIQESGLENLTVSGASTAFGLTLVSTVAGEFTTVDLSGITGGGVTLDMSGLTGDGATVSSHNVILTAGNDTLATSISKLALESLTIDFGTGNATVADVAAFAGAGTLTIKAAPTATGTTSINFAATTADLVTGSATAGTIIDLAGDITAIQTRTIGSAGTNVAGQVFINNAGGNTTIYWDANGDGNFGVGDISIVLTGQVYTGSTATITGGNLVL